MIHPFSAGRCCCFQDVIGNFKRKNTVFDLLPGHVIQNIRFHGDTNWFVSAISVFAFFEVLQPAINEQTAPLPAEENDFILTILL